MSNSMLEKVFLKLAEAAKLLQVSERHLWSKTSPRGPVPCVRIGNAVRYRSADLMTMGSGEADHGQRE